MQQLLWILFASLPSFPLHLCQRDSKTTCVSFYHHQIQIIQQPTCVMTCWKLHNLCLLWHKLGF